MLIGTAGHVDHGKTSLVQALTGVHCDRLAEERRRGITIELGFAPWTLPNGTQASIVDVPGHERLVRTMIVGASGLDLVLLVVAADQGVMPQTREHLAVCEVLGVRRGVVAVTFADRVTDVEQACADIRADLVGTPLADAACVPVCAPKNQGLEALGAAIQAVQTVPRPIDGPVYLPTDRIFTMDGFGTVVTGSLAAGTLSVGQTVDLLPGPTGVRVRGLHVHGRSVETAPPGQRVAVNLTVDHAEIPRGALLISPGSVLITRVIDAEIEWLAHASKPLTRKRGITLHLGAMRATADLRTDAPIMPGQRGTGRLRLDRALPVPPGAHFVLRGDPDLTFGAVFGGGRVLDPAPPRRARDRRRALVNASESTVWTLLRAEAGRRGITQAEIGCRYRQTPPDTFDRFDPELVAQDADALAAQVAAHHAQHPEEPGLARVARLRSAYWRAVLERTEAQGTVERIGALLRKPGHRVRLSSADEGLARKVMRAVGRAGISGIAIGALETRFPTTAVSRIRSVLRHLTRLERVVQTGGLVFPGREVCALRREIAAAVIDGKKLPVAWLKQQVGVSRRQAIPLWTWMDACGVTIREGNLRVAGPTAESYLEAQ